MSKVLSQATIRKSRPTHRKPSPTSRRTAIAVSALAAGAVVATAGSSYLLASADNQGVDHDVQETTALAGLGAAASPVAYKLPLTSDRITHHDEKTEGRDEAERLARSEQVRDERRDQEDRQRQDASRAAEAEKNQNDEKAAVAVKAGEVKSDGSTRTAPAEPLPPSPTEKNEESGNVEGGWAAPTNGRVTSGFGTRWGTTHYGLDIANKIGTPIRSVADGVVVQAGPASGFGLWIRVRHNDGTITVYGHINRYIAVTGQHVKAGEVIAEIGNRGQSTGPHLHFEVWKDGSQKINPEPWLRDRGIKIPA